MVIMNIFIRARDIFFLKLYLFLERGEGREKEGEKHPLVACPQPGVLVCNPGMYPDQNQTSNLSVHRPALNPLSYTSQGTTPRNL